MIYKYFKYFIELSFSVSMFLAAMLFASQAIKIYKTKSVKDLSLTTFLGFSTIQILAILHTYIHNDYQYMIGTMLSFAFCCPISFLIWHYNRSNNGQKKGTNRVIKYLLVFVSSLILYKFSDVVIKHSKYLIELFFSMGLFINALLFVSQAVKLFQTKSSSDLSIITFTGFNVHQILVLLHAYINNDPILMYGYMPSFVSCGLVTFLVFYYRKKNDVEDNQKDGPLRIMRANGTQALIRLEVSNPESAGIGE